MNSEYEQNSPRENSIEQRKPMAELKRMNQPSSAPQQTAQPMQPIVIQCDLPQAMNSLAQALKPGGVWYVSFKYGDSEREKGGRHFSDLTEARLNALVAQLKGIRVQSMWTTQDKRPDRTETWLNALLRKD